jgi:hypothetical protein
MMFLESLLVYSPFFGIMAYLVVGSLGLAWFMTRPLKKR